MIQRSEEWVSARLGNLGCSRLADVLAEGRSGGESATRKNYMAELLCERLTGRQTEHYQTKEMEWGIENESEARIEYEFRTGRTVELHGGREHPEIKRWWGSPDGLIPPDGGIEIKCLNTANHLDVMLSGRVQSRYVYQMAGYVEIFGATWWDYVGYDPRLPDNLAFFCKRFTRDDLPIDKVREGARAFLAELDAMEERLRKI